MAEKNDWRIQDQDSYLKGKTFYFHKYEPIGYHWDHEHCAFCWKKIGTGGIKEAYSTLDDSRWVCEECFVDLKKLFSFNYFQKNTFYNKKISSVINNEINSIIEGEKIYKISKLIKLLDNLSGVKFFPEEMCLMPAKVNLSVDVKKQHEVEIVKKIVIATSDNIFDELMYIKNCGFQWVHFARPL